MDAITTKKLTKYYGKARGIADIDLNVKTGDFFGFIGPNGAGKSTTIRTLLGLIEPTSGTARILGFDIVKDKGNILKKVGYLPSEALFYPGMKVKEILKLSSELRRKDCSDEAKKLCECLQLDVLRKVDELSFGNRKKVAIVCALQHKPELLVLDGPTSGLDPLMQKEFFSILQERNKDGGTVFLSSHVLSEVQHNCTHAAIVREGKIIACDSVDALSKTSAKRITVRGNIDLEMLDCVRDVERTANAVSFLYGGEMVRLLHTLSAGQVQDLAITEPDLEEIFLHYYKEDGETL